MIGATRSKVDGGAAAVCVALAVVVVIRTQFLDTASVSSDSMAPTVCTGDTVLLARLHGDDAVQVGDIVTFPSPQDGTPTIKRVVAVGGQPVAIRDAELVVDEQRGRRALRRSRQHRRRLLRYGRGARRIGVRDG